MQQLDTAEQMFPWMVSYSSANLTPADHRQQGRSGHMIISFGHACMQAVSSRFRAAEKPTLYIPCNE